MEGLREDEKEGRRVAENDRDESTMSSLFAILFTGIVGIFIYPTVLYGYHFPDLGVLAWFYLVPLLVLLARLKGWGRFGASFLASFITGMGSLYWLVPAMSNFGDLSDLESVGILLLVGIIFSFFFSVVLTVNYWAQSKTKLPLFLFNTVFLVCFEFLRANSPFDGFPWSMVAYSQAKYVAFFQWVDVTGVQGLNLMIYLINSLLADVFLAFGKSKKEKIVSRILILILVTVISVFWSVYRQNKMEQQRPSVDSYNLALIQGNIAQEIKWDPHKARSHLQKYINLTDRAARLGVDLVIWPETAYPYTLDLTYISTSRLIRRGTMPVPVLVGAVTQVPASDDSDPLVFNSVFLMGRNTRSLDVYHKRHLVPFGEYIPLKKYLTFARRLTTAVGDFSQGRRDTPLYTGKLGLGVLICYEDLFPDLARKTVLDGANLLVNLTNDAWYGNTSAQHQHVVFSQFRALENRRPLVRATNTGVTAVIDTRGEVIESLEPFTEGMLLEEIHPTSYQSFYTRHGEYVSWFCLFLAGTGLIYGIFKKKRRKIINE